MVAVGVAAMAVVGLGLDEMLTHDLLSEDFTADDGAFASGERSDFEIDVHDGTYRMTTKQPLIYPIRSFGWFARTAYYVDIDATDGSFESFDAAGLVFFSVRAGHSVQFDNVTAPRVI